MPVFVGAGTSSFMKDTGGVGVSTSTTSGRNALSGVRPGQIIFNHSTDLMEYYNCLLYTSPSPRDKSSSRMPSSA